MFLMTSSLSLSFSLSFSFLEFFQEFFFNLKTKYVKYDN